MREQRVDLAWSPAASHGWSTFVERLGAQAPRWTAMGINFHRVDEVKWSAIDK